MVFKYVTAWFISSALDNIFILGTWFCMMVLKLFHLIFRIFGFGGDECGGGSCVVIKISK